MFCEGQLVSISENETLFQLIGTIYGGDGQSTFGLPDLRGRLPIHQGSGPGLSSRQIGESGGAEEITLTSAQMPSHNHPLLATSDSASASGPGGNVLAVTNASKRVYSANLTPVSLAPQSGGATGGSQPHANFQPYLCVDFIISLFGIFPSPT